MDVEVVTAGALLHELGTIRSSGVGYIAQGAQLAEMLQLDKRVVEVIRRHKGVGIGWDDAKLIGLPLPDIIPLELEEQIVSLSDILVKGEYRYLSSDILRRICNIGRWDFVNGVKALYKRLSNLAGLDVDHIGPPHEVRISYPEERAKGMTIYPGRLVAEEDEWTVKRKRMYYKSLGKRLMLVTLTFGLFFAGFFTFVSATTTSNGVSTSTYCISFLIPLLTLVFALVFLHESYGLHPVRVYENGLACKAQKSGDYFFWPWASWETCRYHDNFSLGPVVTIEGGGRNVELLGTMRAFAKVDKLLKMKIIPTFQ